MGLMLTIVPLNSFTQEENQLGYEGIKKGPERAWEGFHSYKEVYTVLTCLSLSINDKILNQFKLVLQF